jgi:undecaprenyl-diphosphatase
MSMLETVVLGLVQGLGEFLPVSSSAHLVLVPWLCRWPDPGLGFDVALHWGTLLAVVAYFRHDIGQLALGFCRSLFRSTRDLRNDSHQKLAWLLVVASIPGAVVGKLLEKKAELAFRHPLLIAAALAAFGLVLLVADRCSRKTVDIKQATWIHAIWIGLSQALAIIPGVSRSGSTIAAGLALGLTREAAARFSFLMSIPIILGAGLVKMKDFGVGVTHGELAVGFLVAAASGFLAIRFLLRYVATRDYRVFVWYRLAIAAVVLALALLR